MKPWSLVVVGLLLTPACTGSNADSRAERTESSVVREAAATGEIVSGCRIEPNTQCPGADLTRLWAYEVDLSGANLAGANLGRAAVNGSNLSGANLSRATLWETELVESNLAGANLTGANLTGAFLIEADLSGANLTGANLYRATLDYADLTGAIFTNTIMPDGKTRNR